MLARKRYVCPGISTFGATTKLGPLKSDNLVFEFEKFTTTRPTLLHDHITAMLSVFVLPIKARVSALSCLPKALREALCAVAEIATVGSATIVKVVLARLNRVYLLTCGSGLLV